MATMVFINLAVKDLSKSEQFFEALGYSINPQFSDDTTACVVISETIYAMIMTEAKMKEFTQKPVADAHSITEAIIALSADSRGAVDALADKALELGGKAFRDPDDYDWMYSRNFEDLDGHQWEIVWMDPSHVE